MAKLLLRTAFALALVAGLIYLVAWLFKKGRASGLIRTTGPERHIHVVESARLGADSYLHLVKVDGRTALIGVGRGVMSIIPWPPDGHGEPRGRAVPEERPEGRDGGRRAEGGVGGEGGVDGV